MTNRRITRGLNLDNYLEAIGYGKAPGGVMYIDIELELLAVGTLGQGEVQLDGFPPTDPLILGCPRLAFI